MIIEIAMGVILLYLLYAFIYEDHPENYPPGPKRMRYFGNIHQLLMMERGPPFEVVEVVQKKYGPICSLKTGVAEQIVTNEYEYIKEILCSETWVDRFADPWISQSFGNNSGIIFVSGDSWREMRRFTLRTLRDFGFGKQKSMESAIEEELGDLCDRVQNAIDGGKKQFEMRHFFNISVLNILWCLVAGVRFSHGDPKIAQLVQVINETSKAFPVEPQPFMIFPIIRFFEPFTKRGKMRLRLYKKLSDFFQEALDARRAEGHYKEEQRDFFDVFLTEIDKRSGAQWTPDGVNHYTDEQFCIVAFDLFVAGADTTANTLEFAFLWMLMHPRVKKRVQEEIDTVVGRSRAPSTLDRPSMPYTEATLAEVQRMANILPIVVRSPVTDTTLGPYRIPKGTIGTLNMYSMHMRADVWGDPKTFRPERFLEQTPDGLKVVNTHKILPFGSGKRVCIGEVLARASLFTYFATLMQRFDFNLPPGAPHLSQEPQIGFTLSPQDYSAIITPR